MIQPLTLLKNLKTSNWFLFGLIIAFVIGACFLKNEPQKIILDSPLPTPRFSVSTHSLFTPTYDLEYASGKSFLNDKLFYPTITCFKKAELLATTAQEKSQAHYGLIFTYFIAKKWDQLKKLYTSGIVEQLDKSAPYFQDAILMFYIALKEENMPFVSQNLKNWLYCNQELKTKLELYDAISQANFSVASFNEHFKIYKANEKSQTLSGMLNLVLPGSGYLYIGQKQTALTCFCLISLLLFSFYYAVKNRHFAQSILIFSLFSGFYFGSIVGAKLGAITWNQSLYNAIFDPVLKDNQLYPEQNIIYAP